MASDIDDRGSSSGSTIFFGPNLVFWWSRKQVIARSNIDAKNRSLAHTTTKLSWISKLLTKLHVAYTAPTLYVIIRVFFLLLIILFSIITHNYGDWCIFCMGKTFGQAVVHCSHSNSLSVVKYSNKGSASNSFCSSLCQTQCEEFFTRKLFSLSLGRVVNVSIL